MNSLLLLATPFLIQARCHWPSSPPGHTAGSCSAAADQNPQVPFLLGTVQPHHPQPRALQGVIVAKMQDSALRFIKLHFVGLCPSTQPFQMSLQSPPIFQAVDTHSQLCVICKFTNERFNTLIHVINENIEQSWSQHRLLRNTTGDWLPAGYRPSYKSKIFPTQE
ncbi:hypothetical protein HGM15179_003868 [Zosterops borbonicus]|uniref:Uncharacterized protein n=1 Tax=Zosterops borbonicus TaxID=364589 RepID=A0A8K1GR55_9PASS|nr:hypothetical protein HGM15179_003868 [Zosterops borbonicus]